jgi:mRNA interferase RelE/StbE
LTYRLVYTQRAIRDIQKLDESTKKRIGKSLLKLEEDPLRYVEKLTDFRLGAYRFRIGDFRVIFDIEDNEIVVLRIAHRRDIYRKR